MLKMTQPHDKSTIEFLTHIIPPNILAVFILLILINHGLKSKNLKRKILSKVLFFSIFIYLRPHELMSWSCTWVRRVLRKLPHVVIE